MKIYTKKGDAGKTSLLTGCRLDKNDTRVVVCGELDELMVELGLLTTYMVPRESIPAISEIHAIQEDLMIISSIIASDGKVLSERKESLLRAIEGFEHNIDQLWQRLPVLTNFVFPRGNRASLHAHKARAICRRVERHAVAMERETPLEIYTELIIPYLNRLSDYLYVTARCVNNIEDDRWVTK